MPSNPLVRLYRRIVGLVSRNIPRIYTDKNNNIRQNTYALCAETMSKKYQVTRIVSVLQTTTVKADSESSAIEASRKLLFKQWTNVDNKRRKGYKATVVEYPER